MSFTIISAVNDDGVLNRCLLGSPDINGVEVLLRRGASGAAEAYNPAIIEAKNDIVILIHQDVYLPSGWFREVDTAIRQLSQTDPNWGVLGVYGVTDKSEMRGHVYCNANQCALGRPISGPVEVETLDEVVLIIRKQSGLQFDSGLRAFHLYGADICLAARQRGFRNYVIPGFCVHNANGYGMFPKSFWTGYFYVRRKWKAQLPITTPCVEIKRSIWPILRGTIWRFCWLNGKRVKLARRVDDPAQLYTRFMARTNAEAAVQT